MARGHCMEQFRYRVLLLSVFFFYSPQVSLTFVSYICACVYMCTWGGCMN